MFSKLDRTDWKVLNLIADNPYRKFYLREIARILNISTSSAKKAIDRIKQLNLVKEEKLANLRIIYGNMYEKLLKQLKITRNIEFIKTLINKLEPSISIVLYGSFAKGENDPLSDIDLLVITNKKKDLEIHEYKGHRTQIIKLTPAQWARIKKDNPALASEIKKGILLKGEMPE